MRKTTALPLLLHAFPGGSDNKASADNAGDLGSIPGWRRSPGEGNGNPLQYFLPGESHGQWNLVGYSPWGHKELDTTEQLHFHFHLHGYLMQTEETLSVSSHNTAKCEAIIPLGWILLKAGDKGFENTE